MKGPVNGRRLADTDGRRERNSWQSFVGQRHTATAGSEHMANDRKIERVRIPFVENSFGSCKRSFELRSMDDYTKPSPVPAPRKPQFGVPGLATTFISETDFVLASLACPT